MPSDEEGAAAPLPLRRVAVKIRPFFEQKLIGANNVTYHPLQGDDLDATLPPLRDAHQQSEVARRMLRYWKTRMVSNGTRGILKLN